MNYLELVQGALFEAGITQTTAEPQSLSDLTGMAERFRRYVAQAWDDIRDLELDQSEVCRAWFQVTVNPRFYFDLNPDIDQEEVFAGDVLEGIYSGATVTVTNVYIANNGFWADRTAQGLIEFTDMTGSFQLSEPLKVQSTGNTSCRFLQWGDYQLSNETEMGTNGFIQNYGSLWWETLRLSDVASANPPSIMQRVVRYIPVSQFIQNYDVNILTLGTPRIVTESPDDGDRIMFYPPPDRPYRLGGYYYTTDTGLVNDTDEPQGLKEAYHPMIIWKAVTYYAMDEQQAGILGRATTRYTAFKKRVDRDLEEPAAFVPKRLF